MTEAIKGFQGEYRFLSNFWEDEKPLHIGGLTAPTAEHLYQALKTNEPREIFWVLDSKSPGEAKRRGREVTVRENWDELRYNAMKTTLGVKFLGNFALMGQLVGTEDAELIESNTWHDNYFGVCSCDKCADEGKVGLNTLGRLLMELRDIGNDWTDFDWTEAG